MPALFLTEQDVTDLLTPAEALEAVERSLHRLARGVVDNRPRERLPLDDGQYAVMACVDRELGYAGLKSYAWTMTGTPLRCCCCDRRPRASGPDRGGQARPAPHRRRLGVAATRA
jgi:hypothetical protein